MPTAGDSDGAPQRAISGILTRGRAGRQERSRNRGLAVPNKPHTPPQETEDHALAQRTLRSFVAVIVASSSACITLAAPPSSAELQSKVDAIAADYLIKPGAAGLSIGVASKGQVVIAKGYGLADAEFDVPADKNTMFRIGSITKQFTAAAIMRLVEQGKLSLDDDLSQFIPDFPLQGNSVTVRQLLNHTSGIPSYADLGEPWAKVQPLELSHTEMLALVKDKPFIFKPGVKWAYNNTAYYMLGMIIEKVTAVSYAQHMQDEYFTPLSLGRTHYDSSSDLMKNRAQGYSMRNGKIVNDAPLGMSQPYSAGSLISTGEDLVKWSMLLTTGKVVKPESFTLMTTPAILPDGENTQYGFGLGVKEWEDRPCISHGGGIHGFNSMLMYLPKEDVHIAVISNGEPLSSGKVANAIASAALGIEKPAIRNESISPEVTKRITGKYRLDQIGLDCKIWEEGGKAMLQASGEGQGAFAIQWQGADVNGGNEFRASFDTDVKLVFTEDGQGFTLFQGGGKVAAKRIAE